MADSPYRTAIVPDKQTGEPRYRIVSVQRLRFLDDKLYSVYYAEKRKSFLFWSWWSMLEHDSFESLQAAEDCIAKDRARHERIIVREIW
jgi:hypothetical protein